MIRDVLLSVRKVSDSIELEFDVVDGCCVSQAGPDPVSGNVRVVLNLEQAEKLRKRLNELRD